MKNETPDKFNDKNADRPAAKAGKAEASEVSKLPSSTTAAAEEIRVPAATPSDADRKAATSKIATLQKEYDSVAEQIRSGRHDAAKVADLVRQKGGITREIDALKRTNGID